MYLNVHSDRKPNIVVFSSIIMLYSTEQSNKGRGCFSVCVNRLQSCRPGRFEKKKNITSSVDRAHSMHCRILSPVTFPRS